MVISESNRSSYFYLEIDLTNSDGLNSHQVKHKIETNIDVILSNIGANSILYKFKSQKKFIYLFSTVKRKRKGQLDKLVEKNLFKNGLIDNYWTISFLKTEFNQRLDRLKQKKAFQLTYKPTIFEGYTARDLEIFKDKKNWFPWQNDLYDMIFHKTGEIKQPHDREIISLYDRNGNSGKRSFFKYLLYNHTNDIARIIYESPAQLRSTIYKMGPKKVYLINLTRSKGKNDNEIDLLANLEDVKSRPSFKRFRIWETSINGYTTCHCLFKLHFQSRCP